MKIKVIKLFIYNYLKMICDILQIIVDFSDFNTSLAIIIANKETNKKIKIKCIKQDKFSHLKILNVNHIRAVTTVNHLRKLEELYACGSCGIDQDGIIEANL